MDHAAQLWDCLRHIRSLRFVAESGSETGWNGIGQGEVTVGVPAEGVLTFTELGTWQSAAGKEFQFRNVFRWSMLGPEIVRLEHLRFGPEHPMFLFDLAPTVSGAWLSASPHICREDCYSAELKPEEWGLSLSWAITGPKKQESIRYQYRP